MDILGASQFPDEEAIGFIWPAGPTETPVKIVVEGHSFTIQPNTEYLAVRPIYEVMENSGYLINGIDQPASPAASAEGGDGAGEAPGGSGSGADSFDPEKIILGTVEEVAAALAGLTPEQLEAVKAAEADREKPRKGVIDAIEQAVGA